MLRSLDFLSGLPVWGASVDVDLKDSWIFSIPVDKNLAWQSIPRNFQNPTDQSPLSVELPPALSNLPPCVLVPHPGGYSCKEMGQKPHSYDEKKSGQKLNPKGRAIAKCSYQHSDLSPESHVTSYSIH